MKKIRARFLTAVLCVFFSTLFCLSSSALSANEYGIGLSVDCEGSEASITISNSNSFAVERIRLSVETAEDIFVSVGENKKTIGTLLPGESFGTRLGFESNIEQVAVQLPQPEAPAATENSSRKAIAAVCTAAAAVLILVLIIRKNKKAAALVLSAVILLPFANIFSVHAIGADEERSFTLETNITVDGEEYPLSVKVDYTASTAKNSYFEFETAPEEAEKNGQTVNRPTTDFSGTATASESVKAVTYEIRSEVDGYEKSITGEADLTGCEWSAPSLALKPGKNEITFTAELTNGEKQTQTYELTYDRGVLYEYKPEEVKEENGAKYVENIINIYFEIDTTDERIAEILAEHGLAQVGEINGVRMIQARTLEPDLNALKAKAAEIEKHSEVISACTEDVVELESNVVPTDSWNVYNTTGYTETWNESMPGGYNWHVEAVQAPSAWDYDKYFNNVAVGVLDGGFKTDHEDYDDLIHFANTEHRSGNDPTSLHGTHVAGIIGAAANNGIGITGLLWDVDIYGANYAYGSSSTITNIVNSVTAQVEAGAKAVNLSLGLTNAYDATTNPNPYLNPFTDAELAAWAGPCAIGMSALLTQGYEFVVVQSAGNGVVDTRISTTARRSEDAYQNGLYCSILENGRYGSLTTAQVKEVYDRILVVGAIRNKSNQSNGLKLDMYEHSNGGDRVDIYAPGVAVFSTIADHYEDEVYYQYAGMTGTSQAAPIVTAIAGMCFAINPDFTGAKVKEIICDEANTAYTVYDYSLLVTVDDGTVLDYHRFEGNGRAVNMKLCAEAALRTVCGKASYTYLNRVVAAAQSLDPNAYTNYEIVQEVIDSIDYNLYEFEQDKVSAKANELIAAMDKLEEKDPADYSEVTKAVDKANSLTPAHYADFSAVTSAVNAVVYGKYADEQEAVDKMAQDILDAIDALELLCKIESNDSEVIADNNKHIIVTVQEKTTDLMKYLSTGGYTATHYPNTYGEYSTFSTVLLDKSAPGSCDSYTVEYLVVTVGDVNGDGKADAEDAVIVNLCVCGEIDMSYEMLFPAFDANCDGSITADDVELLEQVGLYNDVIINLYEPEAAE